MKALVIGGNPAGMSAASRMKRKAPDTEVIVLEKSHEVSYGACGLPYYVAGLNDDLDRIRIRKAPEFENEAHEKAWLISVTSNICKNKLRHTKRLREDELSEFIPDEREADDL